MVIERGERLHPVSDIGAAHLAFTTGDPAQPEVPMSISGNPSRGGAPLMT